MGNSVKFRRGTMDDVAKYHPDAIRVEVFMDGDTLIFVDNNKKFLYNISNKEEINSEVTDMRYDRETLERYAKKCELVGTFNGKRIYACDKKTYGELHTKRDEYYIIYDDCNRFVRLNKLEGMITPLGSIENTMRDGQVYIEPKKEENIPVKFYSTVSDKLNTKEKEAAKQEEAKSTNTNTDDFFAKVDKMIDDILKSEFDYSL